MFVCLQLLGQIQSPGKLLDVVKEWRQKKLNSALKTACMLGNYKMAILVIRAGANNFEQCIKECTQKNRLNHILAYLRLCQAAYENDETALDILLEWDEEKFSGHPRYPSLVDFNTILIPLLDNGTLTINEPLHVALKANHPSLAGKILLLSSKRPSLGMLDWHGLELTELESNWLRVQDYSSLQLLCLSFNSLTKIPSQIAKFSNLVKFQVAFNKLNYVPSAIFEMPSIENIDLSYNCISSLPEALLGKVSSSLHVLTLSSNQLSRFPDYFTESSLKVLDLGKNRFKVVPESVYSIKQLESLNMSHNCEIRFIPYELGGLKHLKVTSFDGLPHTFNVPNDSLMSFIRKRFKSMQTVSHYEIVLIGFPYHSHLLEAVHEKLSESQLDCGILKFDSPIHFLNLHHLLKLPNALYVLLWDCQSRQAPDDLHHVLRHLSIHVPASPTLVTACWTSPPGQLEMEVEEMVSASLWKDLREGVRLEHLALDTSPVGKEGGDGSLGVVPYSYQALFAAISGLSEEVRQTQFVPGSYYSCGQMLTEQQKQYHNDVKSPMLTEDKFWEMVSAMPSHDLSSREELPQLVSYLELVGVLLHIPPPTGSQSLYVFNRQWLCSVLGHILSRQSAQVVQSYSGVVHHEVLIDLMACPSLELPLPRPLQYMLNKEGVALALSSEKWLIPSMLADSPDHTANISENQYGIRRQYTFNLTPANFWCRLIAHLLMNMENLVREVSEGGDSHFSPGSSFSWRNHNSTLPRQGVIDWTYWSQGILCWQNACHLVYSIESIPSTCSNPYQETIEVRVPNDPIGYRVMHRLSLIIDTLLKNWYPEVWSSVEIWAPCSHCLYTGMPDVPSIPFEDCLLAMAKGVGVACMQHPDKIVSIAHIIPDLIQEDVNSDVFLPPGSVEFSVSDKSTCLSPPPTETVFKGTYSKHLVAVKPFPHVKMQGIVSSKYVLNQECPPLLQMWSEFEIFQLLQPSKCPFIIEVIGVCPDPLCLVFPFARWSSLEDVYHTKDIKVPHMVQMKVVYQLASALSALQSCKIIHRNICLGNLLVFSLSANDAVNIKLSGFSNACYGIFQGISIGQFGSFPAPEMLLTTHCEYDERVDIFAFAFVAYEIITQNSIRLQTDCTHSRPCLQTIRTKAPYLVPLLSQCWHPDRNRRPFASKVVQLLKHPMHVLVRDGQLVDYQHEFFAASARFTRVQNNVHSDLFVSSGQLMGKRTSFLSRVSLPGLSFETFKQLPSEFVICMGCIGSQLWVSFYGKKVRVYSALNMEFVNEFTFNFHVVSIAISPTSVYLGLENGVLQVYEVTESVPTEPNMTKIVSAGEEFKCLEAMEDSLICATKDTIFCLHPDTLNIEEKWNINSEREIRCIVISRCNRTKDEDELEGNDLMWVAFRRWEKLLVMNPWTGQCYYSIDCARVLSKPAAMVYVQSLRVVLDTVWVGLNTGHILVFSSNHQNPVLLTHFKVHREGVRQLLLLHPSYMGPSTVLSTAEINQSLRDPQSTLIADNQKSIFPDSVLVVSFGNGLEDPVCSVDKHCGVVEASEGDAEVNKIGLFAVIIEGASASRMVQVEKNSERDPLPYMDGFEDSDDELYAVPPDGIIIYDTPGSLVPSNIPRVDTISSQHSNGVDKNHYARIPASQGSDGVDGYSSSGGTLPTISSFPPREAPQTPERATMPTKKGKKSPKSPLSSLFSLRYRSSRKNNGGRISPVAPSQSPGPSPSTLNPPTAVPPVQKLPLPLPPESVTPTHATALPGAGASADYSTTESRPRGEDVKNNTDDDDSEEEDGSIYSYAYQDPDFIRGYTLPNLGAKPIVPTRRLTHDDCLSRPDLEDSAAEGFEPYVRMDSFLNQQAPNLRQTANRANKRAKAIRQTREQGAGLSEVPEEDFTTRDEFLGRRVEQDLALDCPPPSLKIKPLPPPKPTKM